MVVNCFNWSFSLQMKSVNPIKHLYFSLISLSSPIPSPHSHNRKSDERMSGPVISYSCKQNRPGPYPQEAYYSLVGEWDCMWIINIKGLIKWWRIQMLRRRSIEYEGLGHETWLREERGLVQYIREAFSQGTIFKLQFVKQSWGEDCSRGWGQHLRKCWD